MVGLETFGPLHFLSFFFFFFVSFLVAKGSRARGDTLQTFSRARHCRLEEASKQKSKEKHKIQNYQRGFIRYARGTPLLLHISNLGRE